MPDEELNKIGRSDKYGQRAKIGQMNRIDEADGIDQMDQTDQMNPMEMTYKDVTPAPSPDPFDAPRAPNATNANK